MLLEEVDEAIVADDVCLEAWESDGYPHFIEAQIALSDFGSWLVSISSEQNGLKLILIKHGLNSTVNFLLNRLVELFLNGFL